MAGTTGNASCMKWIFLIASFFSASMALLFAYLSVYYVLNYPQSWRVSWRVIAPLSVVLVWTMLTYKAFLRLRGIKPK
jgi:hypothetical protein